MKKTLALLLSLLLLGLAACCPPGEEDDLPAPEKPVIYLYPETETDVCVRLTLDGALTCTYPAYPAEGWQTYRYLCWEGISRAEFDLSSGFCVRGEDTAAFLEDALARLGLTRAEANEFIIYWLPRMEGSAYNLLSFQQEAYTDSAVLTVEPAPDTVLRVFLAWKPLEEPVELPAQQLTAPERRGFTLVEWGGSQLN